MTGVRVKCHRGAGLLLALLPVLVFAAEPQPQSDEVRAWIEKSMAGISSLNFEGTFVYVQGGRLEAMRIVHGHDASGEWQRLSSLSGAPRQVVLGSRSLTCSLPQGKVSLSSNDERASPFPVTLPANLDALAAHYRFELAGEDRVADHATQVLSLLPRDSLRYGYRLWLEEQTGMVVRTALLDERGEPLEQLMFTELHFLDSPPTPPADVPSRKDADAPATQERLRIQSGSGLGGQQAWTFATLPAGFAEVRFSRFDRLGDGRLTDHYVLSDGLATISVFVESLDSEEPLLRGYSRTGAMSALGRVIDGKQIVVIGEVPRSTVEAVALALQPASGAARATQ